MLSIYRSCQCRVNDAQMFADMMRIIACIEDAVVIRAILARLVGKAYSAQPRLPPGRAPSAPVVS